MKKPMLFATMLCIVAILTTPTTSWAAEKGDPQPKKLAEERTRNFTASDHFAVGTLFNLSDTVTIDWSGEEVILTDHMVGKEYRVEQSIDSSGAIRLKISGLFYDNVGGGVTQLDSVVVIDVLADKRVRMRMDTTSSTGTSYNIMVTQIAGEQPGFMMARVCTCKIVTSMTGCPTNKCATGGKCDYPEEEHPCVWKDELVVTVIFEGGLYIPIEPVADSSGTPSG